MFLLQMAQAPVPVRLGNLYDLEIPKYTLGDAVALGARIVADYVEEVTKDMEHQQKAEYLTLYPPVTPGLARLRNEVRTIPGAEDVIRTCVGRARIFNLADGKRDSEITDVATLKNLRPKILEMIFSGNGGGALVFLAWELADLEDKSLVAPPQRNNPPANGNGDEGGSADPLPRTANPVSVT